MKRSKSVQGKIPSTHLHLKRRSSVEVVTSTGRSFLIDVQTTIEQLLSQEDTDNNFQITIQDTGPKLFKLGSAASAGHNTITVAGNYMVSNLLQELAIASHHNRRTIILQEDQLYVYLLMKLKETKILSIV